MYKKNLSHTLGVKGEQFACNQLKYYGLDIITRNFKIEKIGEVDIIARDGLTLCFVEVKTRQISLHSNPRDAINWKKRLNSWKTAMAYLKKIHNPQINYRFDMVEVFAKKQQIKYSEYLTHIFNKDDIKKVI